MIKVGVTGGIGSGKTTFCKKWEELGAFVLYADDFAKELMVTDQELITSVKKTFGDEAYYEDGSLNREYLAQQAFEKGRVEELNAIVHPVLWQRVDELANQKEKEGIEVFVKEAAILLQHGRPENLNYVILLLADEEVRVQRSVQRDQSDPKKVKDRILKQTNFKTKRSEADFIIENNGSLEELEMKAQEVFELIK